MNEDEKWSSAAFCVSSTTLTPEEVARRIGLPPTRADRIGDPVSSRNPNARRARHYYAVHADRASSRPMGDHLEALLELLEPRRAAIAELRGQADLSLFCGFSSGNGQGGFVLTPEILRRLSAANIELVLDLYPPDAIDGPSTSAA